MCSIENKITVFLSHLLHGNLTVTTPLFINMSTFKLNSYASNDKTVDSVKGVERAVDSTYFYCMLIAVTGNRDDKDKYVVITGH